MEETKNETQQNPQNSTSETQQNNTTDTKKRERPESPPADQDVSGQPAKKKTKSSNVSVAALVRKEKYQLSKFHKWSCQDDLLLKSAVEKGLNAEEIASTIKFGTKFTPQEITERWGALLHDEKIAQQASKSMVILLQTSKRVPWSEAEDEIIMDELKKRGFISFQYLLDKYRDKFHPSRTIRSLEAHFYRLKRNGVFDNITHLHSSKASKETEKLSDVEKEIMKSDHVTEDDIQITREDILQERKESKQAVKLEKEHSFEQPLDSYPFTKNQFVFAELQGKNTKLFITKETSLVGRKNSEFQVDLDLSLEGEAKKISRRQATIYIVAITKTKTSQSAIGSGKKSSSKKSKNITVIGQFKIKNIGKRNILVNNEAIAPEQEKILHHNCLLEFPGGLRFVVHINQAEVDKWLSSKTQQQ